VTRAIVTSLALLALGACGSKPKPAKIAAANAFIGDCVDPKGAGVLSASPDLREAHRDLNGDGRNESVYADRQLCRKGNCYWNLFTKDQSCERYIGTVAGATLEILDHQADGGFHELRGWWKLASGTRQLVQSYRFRSGGYQLIDVLVCRQEGDDRLLCAAEEQNADPAGD
jgi:hypothetical protein